MVKNSEFRTLKLTASRKLNIVNDKVQLSVGCLGYGISLWESSSWAFTSYQVSVSQKPCECWNDTSTSVQVIGHDWGHDITLHERRTWASPPWTTYPGWNCIPCPKDQQWGYNTQSDIPWSVWDMPQGSVKLCNLWGTDSIRLRALSDDLRGNIIPKPFE